MVGVENDENRKNQQQMIDFLKSKRFVSGIRPRVELRTLMLAGHEVDVLIIKNSTDTPYFLTEDFSDNGRKVRANYIYTRVGDTNTDIDKSADINNIEYLWKKRFLLTRSPFEQIIKRLENKDEWKHDEDTYYNIFNPEFTIIIGGDDEVVGRRRAEFYAYVMVNSSPTYLMLNIKYFGTQLFDCQVVLLDGGRYTTLAPERGYLFFSRDRTCADYSMRYFTKDSPEYKLNEFLYDAEDREAEHARRGFFEVVLLFKDLLEKDTFLGYVHRHKDDFLNRLAALEGEWSWIEATNQREQEHIVIQLKTGNVLNQMLQEFREIDRSE
ncbi:hypothetical protein D3C74_99720 [compost metagenome]